MRTNEIDIVVRHGLQIVFSAPSSLRHQRIVSLDTHNLGIVIPALQRLFEPALPLIWNADISAGG